MPYGRNFRRAGGWKTGRFKCLIKQVSFSLDLKVVSKSAIVTMFGTKFQRVGAVQWKAHHKK